MAQVLRHMVDSSEVVSLRPKQKRSGCSLSDTNESESSAKIPCHKNMKEGSVKAGIPFHVTMYQT